MRILFAYFFLILLTQVASAEDYLKDVRLITHQPIPDRAEEVNANAPSIWEKMSEGYLLNLIRDGVYQNSELRDLDQYISMNEVRTQTENIINTTLLELRGDNPNEPASRTTMVASGLILPIRVVRNLFTFITNNILEKQGIPAHRRQYWNQRINSQFNICIGDIESTIYKARFLSCLNIAQQDLKANIPLAIVYEKSIELFSPKDQPDSVRSDWGKQGIDLYKKCYFEKFRENANAHMECTLRSISRGLKILAASRAKDQLTEKELPKEIVKKLVIESALTYDSCAENLFSKSGNKNLDVQNEFIKCANEFALTVAKKAADYIISKNDTIAENFDKPGERQQFVSQNLNTLSGCLSDLKKSKSPSSRDEQGIVRIDKCTDPLTNNMTKQVMLRAFQNIAQSTLSPALDAILDIDRAHKKPVNYQELENDYMAKMNQKIGSILSCFKEELSESKRYECMRNSIKEFAKTMTEEIIFSKVRDLPNAQEFIAKYSKEMVDCVESGLPKSFAKSKDLALIEKTTNACKIKLTKSAAQPIAEATIRFQGTKNKIPQSEIDSMIQSEIILGLKPCVDTAKDDSKKLDSCIEKYSKTIGLSLINKSLQQVVRESIPDAPFKSFERDRKQVLDALQAENQTCFTGPLQLDECLAKGTKSATKSIALAAAKNSVAKLINANWDRDLPTILPPIELKLNQCVDNIEGNSSTTNKELEKCKIDFLKKLMQEMAPLSVDYILTNAMGYEVRHTPSFEEAYNKIFTDYADCLNRGMKEEKFDPYKTIADQCTKNLELGANNLAKEHISKKLALNISNDKDASTLAAANQVEQLLLLGLPCLASLIPAQPFDPDYKNNRNLKDNLAILAEVFASTINYDPNSSKDYIIQAATQIQKAINENKTQEEAMDMIMQSGLLDFVVRAAIYDKTNKSISGLIADNKKIDAALKRGDLKKLEAELKKVPKDDDAKRVTLMLQIDRLKNGVQMNNAVIKNIQKVADKDYMDKLLKTDEFKKVVRQFYTENLKPAIYQGQKEKITDGISSIIDYLAQHKDFGEKVSVPLVQYKMDSLAGAAGFVKKAFDKSGSTAFQWQKQLDSEKGQLAQKEVQSYLAFQMKVDSEVDAYNKQTIDKSKYTPEEYNAIEQKAFQWNLENKRRVDRAECLVTQALAENSLLVKLKSKKTCD